MSLGVVEDGGVEGRGERLGEGGRGGKGEEKIRAPQ